jgi:hypothetical protein
MLSACSQSSGEGAKLRAANVVSPTQSNRHLRKVARRVLMRDFCQFPEQGLSQTWQGKGRESRVVSHVMTLRENLLS